MTGKRERKVYSSPTLVRYGDLAGITAGGVGSVVETGGGNTNKKPG